MLRDCLREWSGCTARCSISQHHAQHTVLRDCLREWSGCTARCAPSYRQNPYSSRCCFSSPPISSPGAQGAEKARRRGAPTPPALTLAPRRSRSFLCLITPLCSYLYGGLYGGLHESAHIIRCFPPAASRPATWFSRTGS
jgi:hypothetical protein